MFCAYYITYLSTNIQFECNELSELLREVNNSDACDCQFYSNKIFIIFEMQSMKNIEVKLIHYNQTRK